MNKHFLFAITMAIVSLVMSILSFTDMVRASQVVQGVGMGGTAAFFVFMAFEEMD